MLDKKLGDGIARQELNLLFLIDTSGSMEGERIGAVNNAIRDVLALMPEIQEDTSDVVIKISALLFNDEAKFLYSEPKTIEDFKWHDVKADGCTNLSAAYESLEKYLTKKSNGGQMPDIGGVAPIIIMMTDGLPTSYDWYDKLSLLKKKGWFRVALKYALSINIEDEEAMDVLKAFTGNPETVLKVYSAEALRKVIKVIAVTASRVKSNSSSTNFKTQSNNDIAQDEIKTQLDEVSDIQW